MDYYAKDPLIRTPFTDFGHLFGRIDCQGRESVQCKRFELKYLDCMDAYGVEKGSVKCNDFLEDLFECMHNNKQNKRYDLMRAERIRQSKEKKTDVEYISPPPPELLYQIKI